MKMNFEICGLKKEDVAQYLQTLQSTFGMKEYIYNSEKEPNDGLWKITIKDRKEA